jgi:photosystem II stability/assembly factor-like uncharacterized protein
MDTHNKSPINRTADFVYQFAAETSDAQDRCDILFAARASGLYGSRDKGETWESAYKSIQTSERLPTLALALSPDYKHVPHVIAGLNGAILRSHDGGENWQVCRVPAPPPVVTCMLVSPQYPSDGKVFAGTYEDGVLVSDDFGENWVSWNFGLLDLNTLCLAISPDFANDETLYAGTVSGLFHSTNSGRAWKEVSLPNGFDAVLSLAISPYFARDATLYAGTENSGLIISKDRGKTWRSFAEALRDAPINSILLYPDVRQDGDIMILHGGALLLSRDCGETWKPWRKKTLARKNITAICGLGGRRSGFLIGFEDGSVSRII